MSETKFTPGPWKAMGRTICPKNQLDPLNTEIVCRIYENRFASREEANASLIAAAPEMYEALKEMLSALKDVVNINYMSDSAFALANDAMAKAEKALKKARGER